MAENRTRPEEFKDRIIFVPMYNDIDWTEDGNLKKCGSNVVDKEGLRTQILEGTWVIFGPGTGEKWCGTHTNKPEGLRNQSAEMTMRHFGESGHSVFRATSALDRGSLKSKGGGKLSIHYIGDSTTSEFLFRTIISVNQLSVYGAAQYWKSRSRIIRINTEVKFELNP